MTRLKTQTGRIVDQFSITGSRKPSLAKLVNLPLEVLVEILVLMEWKDILRVRQTCQRLRDASLSRPVWLSLVQWYSATVQPRPFLPEKPLELYTDRELEYLILRWQSGKAGRTLTQPRELALSKPEGYLQSVQLLPGGRWLLLGVRDGSVKYHDLNTPGETSQSITLVSSHFDRDANTLVLLSVDMDLDAEYTTFNLGIMSWRLHCHDHDYPNPPRFVRWIEISRVTSYWDENGRVLGLRAERLACFREVYMCGCDSFTLGGRHVAYSMYSYETGSSVGDGESIAIVDWTSVDPNSLTYPRRLFWRLRTECLALVSDDRLLYIMTPEILLFDLRDAALTTLPPAQHDQPPSPDPIASLRLWANAISPPYRAHNSTRFSVLTDEGVKGLIIPHAPTIDCVDLLSYSTHSFIAQLGYNCAVLSCSSGPSMLHYAWPEDHSSSIVPQRSTIQTSFAKFLFDEHSSRIVSLGVGSMIESILDLSAM